MKKTLIAVLTLLLTATLFISVTNTTAQVEAAVVSIPDANLAAAIRDALGLPSGAPITSHAMLNLTRLDAPGRGITELTGLEYATNLIVLDLRYTAVSDVAPLAKLTLLIHLNLGWTAVADVAPLAHLTQLTTLWLYNTAVADVAPLAKLTLLKRLSLSWTAVADVAPLAKLTLLRELDLRNCPLNAAAHQTHLPAIQANGTEVKFDPFKPIHLPRVPGLVSLIYFRPSDQPIRPNVDAEIDGLIKKAQRFYADEMERHGFKRKTFQFETDAHGAAVVHHVNGKFTDEYYRDNRNWREKIREQVHAPVGNITVQMIDTDGPLPGTCGVGGGSPYGGGRAGIYCWAWRTLAHELGHAFGMDYHDFRDNAYLMSYGSQDELSHCFAEWLDVHPAFNTPPAVRRNARAEIEMLPATLVAPPNTVRLRFAVTAPAGSLYQARLLTRETTTLTGSKFNTGGLIDCQRLNGNPTSSTVEFVTTALTPETKWVELYVIGRDGSGPGQRFPIDVSSLLPAAKVVSIPDPNLAAAVREALELSSGEAITTHAMLRLDALGARNAGIKDLTGLEHAVGLTALNLRGNYSDQGWVNSNAISDWSPLAKLAKLQTLELSSMSGLVDVAPLAKLTQLTTLWLRNTAVSDVAPLAKLTQLTNLYLRNTAVSDVAPLAKLTQLTTLNLEGTAVADVAPLAKLTQLTSLNLGWTAVADVAPLAKLTQLRGLYLHGTAVSDVAPLAKLTQLTTLYLDSTAVSDVAPLAKLTQLTWLDLGWTAVADVSPLLGMSPGEDSWDGLYLKGCPLSYASLHTHIPAIQAKGIEVDFDNIAHPAPAGAFPIVTPGEVDFDNIAHPALLKISGDEQEGAGDTALKNPFVVEAMDEHGKPIVGKTVQFEVLAGGGTLSTQTATTDARGKAQITLTLGRSAGINKVKATAEGIESWALFTTVATEAAPQLAADVNGDGVTDLADLAIVAQAMGKPVQNPRADVNGDGVVDGEDFARVAAALGEGEAAAPSQAVLPAGLTLEKVEWALNLLHAENTGSPAFQRGIAKLEGFLALLVPEKTLLLANYPNPFNPETWIPYQLAAPAEVTVTIYAANGAVVRTLALGHQRAGDYASRSRAAYWDGRNEVGERVASGVYFYTLQAGDFAATRKMLILK